MPGTVLTALGVHSLNHSKLGRGSHSARAQASAVRLTSHRTGEKPEASHPGRRSQPGRSSLGPLPAPRLPCLGSHCAECCGWVGPPGSLREQSSALGRRVLSPPLSPPGGTHAETQGLEGTAVMSMCVKYGRSECPQSPPAAQGGTISRGEVPSTHSSGLPKYPATSQNLSQEGLGRESVPELLSVASVH